METKQWNDQQENGIFRLPLFPFSVLWFCRPVLIAVECAMSHDKSAIMGAVR